MRRWFAPLRSLPASVLAGAERFPAAVVALAAFAVYINLEIADVIAASGAQIWRAGTAATAAAAAAAALTLCAERRGTSASVRASLSFLLAAVVGGAIWFWDRLGIAWPALLAAAVLAVPLAPYLGASAAGFWAFLWRIGHAFALAFLAVLVFCAGVSVILITLDQLFGLKPDDSLYQHVWSIGLGFVGPLFALSLIPIAFPDRDVPERSDVIAVGIRILSDFVAVPLFLAYAVVLHAYALKVVLTGEVPKNQIGWMVLTFGLATLALRTIVHPLGALTLAPTRLFIRYWAVPLVVPLALFLWAVWIRIEGYGLTPDRYGLVLFGLFLLLVLLAQASASWRQDARIVPGLAAVLLLLASFGPWGAISLPAAWQTNRLMDRLAAAGLLQNGRLVSAPDLDYEAASDIRSIVDLLANLGELDRLRPLFEEGAQDPFAGAALHANAESVAWQVRERLRVARLPPRPDPTGRFWINFGADGAIDIDDYDLVIPNVAWFRPEHRRADVGVTSAGSLTIETSATAIAIAGPAAQASIPVETLRADFSARLPESGEGGESRDRAPLFVERTVAGRRIGLLFTNVMGTMPEGAEMRVGGGQLSVYLRRSDWAGN